MDDRENGNISLKILKKGTHLGKIIKLSSVYIFWIYSDDHVSKRNAEFEIIYLEILRHSIRQVSKEDLDRIKRVWLILENHSHF